MGGFFSSSNFEYVRVRGILFSTTEIMLLGAD